MSVSWEAGINSGMLYQWVQKYKSLGYNGLINKTRGRSYKESNMKKVKSIILECYVNLN